MCIYSRGAYNTVRSGQRHLRPCSAALFKRFAPSYICIQIFNTLFVSITVCSFFFYCSCVFHFCVALHFIYNVFQVVHLFTPPTPLSQIFKTSFALTCMLQTTVACPITSYSFISTPSNLTSVRTRRKTSYNF